MVHTAISWKHAFSLARKDRRVIVAFIYLFIYLFIQITQLIEEITRLTESPGLQKGNYSIRSDIGKKIFSFNYPGEK